MLKREILLTNCAIVLALSGQEAKAAEACTATPTCAALGYTKTDCGGYLSLKCPFDRTKLFCGKECAPGSIVGKITGKCGLTNPDIPFSGALAISPTVAMTAEVDDRHYYKYNEAETHCANLTIGGKKWRMPTEFEMMQIDNGYVYSYIPDGPNQIRGSDWWFRSKELKNGKWVAKYISPSGEYKANISTYEDLEDDSSAAYVICVCDLGL